MFTPYALSVMDTSRSIHQTHDAPNQVATPWITPIGGMIAPAIRSNHALACEATAICVHHANIKVKPVNTCASAPKSFIVVSFGLCPLL